jgi:DNA repair protein RadA/Sms
VSKAAKTVFECTACGAQSPKWLGRCPGCGSWSTLEENRVAPRSNRAPARSGSGGVVPVAIGDVVADDAERFTTGIVELDRVLGGGVVRGGVTLLGGEPGIGKSTLLMQAVAGVAASGKRVLYVTGEESAAQVAMRARRLGVPDRLLLLATTDVGDALNALASERYDMAVIDSIQTLRSSDLESAAGSVCQLRDVAGRLTEFAKTQHVAMFVIGHVTKDGSLAGPKMLEHLVDTVLSFEGDATYAFRIIRATKNRFGPAQELGVFEMASDGLREVADASSLFIAERPLRASGSVVLPTTQGTRPLLVEVQALVAPALYGAPRRVTTGLDANRLAVLLAVLQRRAAVQVLDQDVFASVAGGVRIDEPAVDLALSVAIVSSLRDRPVPAERAVFGEIGLTGELRAVARPAVRIQEAKKLGFTHVVLPQANIAHLSKEERAELTLLGAKDLDQALALAFGDD